MTKLLGAVACAFMLAAAPAAASAQTIGFKVGPTFSEMTSSLDTDDDNGRKRLTSFGGGGFVRFGLAGLSLQLEALAITKGTAFELQDPDLGELSGKLKMTYLEVPLTAMFSLGKGPYVFGGPTVGFELQCKSEANFGGTEFSSDCDEDDGSGEGNFDRRKVDVGVTAGLGFQLPLGPGQILIEGRHTWGLTNLNPDDSVDNSEVRHRSIAVFAGFAIPLGSR